MIKSVDKIDWQIVILWIIINFLQLQLAVKSEIVNEYTELSLPQVSIIPEASPYNICWDS